MKGTKLKGPTNSKRRGAGLIYRPRCRNATTASWLPSGGARALGPLQEQGATRDLSHILKCLVWISVWRMCARRATCHTKVADKRMVAWCPAQGVSNGMSLVRRLSHSIPSPGHLRTSTRLEPVISPQASLQTQETRLDHSALRVVLRISGS